jgi:hypothetical protein
VITVFLRGELDSGRPGATVRGLLDRVELTEELPVVRHAPEDLVGWRQLATR